LNSELYVLSLRVDVAFGEQLCDWLNLLLEEAGGVRDDETLGIGIGNVVRRSSHSLDGNG
jgi:hypothetical protein